MPYASMPRVSFSCCVHAECVASPCPCLGFLSLLGAALRAMLRACQSHRRELERCGLLAPNFCVASGVQLAPEHCVFCLHACRLLSLYLDKYIVKAGTAEGGAGAGSSGGPLKRLGSLLKGRKVRATKAVTVSWMCC